MKDKARESALLAGKRFYENGKACKHGHVGLRLSESTSCFECKQKWLKDNRQAMRDHRRKWREANPEKSLACTAAWATNNPEKKKEKDRKWHLANQDYNNARARKWQQDNRERAALRSAKWKQENRDKVSSYTRNRWAMVKGSVGTHTADDVANIRRKQKNKCAYCRINLDRAVAHVDHVVPLVLGGDNNPSNLQILCQSCNCSKGGKHPIEYAQFIGKLL